MNLILTWHAPRRGKTKNKTRIQIETVRNRGDQSDRTREAGC